MRLIELFEYSSKEPTGKIPNSFWINAISGEIINAPSEHVEAINKNPEQFGISVTDIQRVKSLTYPESKYGLGWTAEIMELVGEKGWVRVGKEIGKNSYFFQGLENSHLLSAVRKVNKIIHLSSVYIDNFLETFASSSFIKLEGHELNHWLKTGNYLPRNSRVAQFHESIDFDNSDDRDKVSFVQNLLAKGATFSDIIKQMQLKNIWIPIDDVDEIMWRYYQYKSIFENVISFSNEKRIRNSEKFKNKLNTIANELPEALTKQQEIEEFINDQIQLIKINNPINKIVATPTLQKDFKEGITAFDALFYSLPIYSEPETTEEILATEILQRHKNEIQGSIDHELRELRLLTNIAQTAPAPRDPMLKISYRIHELQGRKDIVKKSLREDFTRDPYTAEYKFNIDPKTVTSNEFNKMIRELNNINTEDPILVNGITMLDAKAAGKELMRLIQPRIDSKKKTDADNEAKWASHRWDQGNYKNHAELVPISWLKKLKGNDLRLGGKTAQGIGYNVDTNEHEYGDFDQLVMSLAVRGVQEPILIIVGMRDGYAYIGEGNHRLAAAEKLGWKEFPTRVIVQTETYTRDKGQYKHNVRNDLTWNPDELDSFPKEKYYTKPSQVFKSLSYIKESINESVRHKWINNPNHNTTPNAQRYFHTTKKKNTKHIFDEGLIPGKTKGQMHSDEIWVWTKSQEKFLETFKGKTEDAIVVELLPEEIKKMPDANVAMVTKFSTVPNNRIVGAFRGIKETVNESFVEYYKDGEARPGVKTNKGIVDPEYLYRVMSKNEYEMAKDKGYFKGNPIIHASFSPDTNYMNSSDDIIVKFKYNPHDDWRAKWGKELYAYTRENIPFNRASLVEGKLNSVKLNEFKIPFLTSGEEKEMREKWGKKWDLSINRIKERLKDPNKIMNRVSKMRYMDLLNDKQTMLGA